MSSLRQLRITYDHLQDRLVFTMQTNDFNEFNFWLTRRLTKPMWDLLVKLLAADTHNLQQIEEIRKKIERQILQEKSQLKPTAEKLSQNIAKHPLGGEPALLVQITGRVEEKGFFTLHLVDVKGNAIDCRGDAHIILGICELILQTTRVANWDLDLKISPENP